jgi:hypothetical protein
MRLTGLLQRLNWQLCRLIGENELQGPAVISRLLDKSFNIDYLAYSGTGGMLFAFITRLYSK